MAYEFKIVRRERVARGLTQERLAELMAVNPRTIQKIEAEKLNILLTTSSGYRQLWAVRGIR